MYRTFSLLVLSRSTSDSSIYSTPWYKGNFSVVQLRPRMKSSWPGCSAISRGLEIRWGSRDGPGTRLTEISRVVGQIMVFNPLLGIALCFQANLPETLARNDRVPTLEYFASLSRHVSRVPSRNFSKMERFFGGISSREESNARRKFIRDLLKFNFLS